MSEQKAAEKNDAGAEKSEPKVYSEEQFSGLLADKQAEVKKQQELERKLTEVEARQNQNTRIEGSGTFFATGIISSSQNLASPSASLRHSLFLLC